MEIGQNIFPDAHQRPRSGFAVFADFRDVINRVVRNFQINAEHGEFGLVLRQDRIFGVGHDADEIIFRKQIDERANRHAPDKLRQQAEPDIIIGGGVFEIILEFFLLFVAVAFFFLQIKPANHDAAVFAHVPFMLHPLFDDFFQFLDIALKRAA